MTDSGSGEFMTIGVLARASGLTPSALRFYDDCGLLVPARVDAATGYRYYTESQRALAVTIRRLRAVDVPLDTVAAVLAGDQAEYLLDEHVADLEKRAREAVVVVEAVKQALRLAAATSLVALHGTELADAIEQVRTATAGGAEIAVLAGILIEADSNSLVLTATD